AGFVPLCVLFNSFMSDYGIMAVKYRHLPLDFACVHPDDLKVGFIHNVCDHSAGPVLFGGKPRFYHNNGTRSQVTSEISHRLLQTFNGFDITDRTEQTDDHVKAPIQVKVHHIRLVEGNSSTPQASYSQQFWTQI